MRLFLALELPKEVRLELARAIEAARPILGGARWVRPENLHATILFLGEQDEAGAETAARIAAATCALAARRTARLGEAGVFPTRGPARVAWIALEVEPDAAPLVAELERRCVEARLLPAPAGRPFAAHVTLARAREPWPAAARDAWLATRRAIAAAPFGVASLTLFESELGPAGPRYRRRAELPLAEAA